MSDEAGGLRSGQVAAAAGVHLETLRYYERRGLIAEPERSLGGHRLYPADAITRVRVIKVAQRLGFTLTEVADLLDTAQHRHAHRDGAGLRQRAEVKLVQVQARIADLETTAEMLRDAIAQGCDDLTECADHPDCPLPFARLANSPLAEEPA